MTHLGGGTANVGQSRATFRQIMLSWYVRAWHHSLGDAEMPFRLWHVSELVLQVNNAMRQVEQEAEPAVAEPLVVDATDVVKRAEPEAVLRSESHSLGAPENFDNQLGNLVAQQTDDGRLSREYEPVSAAPSAQSRPVSTDRQCVLCDFCDEPASVIYADGPDGSAQFGCRLCADCDDIVHR